MSNTKIKITKNTVFVTPSGMYRDQYHPGKIEFEVNVGGEFLELEEYWDHNTNNIGKLEETALGGEHLNVDDIIEIRKQLSEVVEKNEYVVVGWR